jgi:hypothetical protein
MPGSVMAGTQTQAVTVQGEERLAGMYAELLQVPADETNNKGS